jgi:hypothetical protein
VRFIVIFYLLSSLLADVLLQQARYEFLRRRDRGGSTIPLCYNRALIAAVFFSGINLNSALRTASVQLCGVGQN